MSLTPQFVPALGRALGFSAADLGANREGRMTSRQIRRMLMENSVVRLVYGLICLATFFVVLVLTALLLRSPNTVSVLVYVVLAAVAALLAGAARNLLRGGVRAIREVTASALERYEGPVVAGGERFQDAGRLDALGYYIVCGDLKLWVTYPAYRMIEDGRLWRVFSTRLSDHPLSMEPLFSFAPTEEFLRPRPSFLPVLFWVILGAPFIVIGWFLGDGGLVVVGLILLVGVPFHALSIWRGTSD